MSSYAESKSSISGSFSGRCLLMKCASLFINIVFHKLCKTYIFAYAKLYVYFLHKYMFLHMQKYIPCTKHVVLHMQNI